MIGLFDSGVGGLFTLRALRRRLPRADLIYFGDTRHLPYGEKTEEEILSFARAGARFLTAQGAGAVLFACGTAGSIALPTLRGELDVPLCGTPVPTAAAAAAAYRGGRILLPATKATVRAGRLAYLLEKACHAPVEALACPQLVEMAEAGAASRTGEGRLAALLTPYQAAPPEMIVLGCTHFSYFAPAMRRLFPSAVLVDSAVEAARAAARFLPPSLLEGQGRCCLWASGDTDDFARRAHAILGEPIPVYPM